MFLKVMGELRKNLWGRHLMLWGMWEKVKTVGELEKSWGSSRNPWGSHFVGAVTEGCSLVVTVPQIKEKQRRGTLCPPPSPYFTKNSPA